MTTCNMTTCSMTIAASSSKTLRWKSSTSTSALFSLLKFWWHNILLIGIVSICQWHCPNHGHHYHHYFALSEWWKTKSGEKILRCVSNNTPSCGNLHRWGHPLHHHRHSDLSKGSTDLHLLFELSSGSFALLTIYRVNFAISTVFVAVSIHSPHCIPLIHT